MKRLIALVLSLILICAMVCACSPADNEDGGDTNSTTSTVKIKNQVKDGKIPELPIALGCDVNEAMAALDALEKRPENADVEEGYTYYTSKTKGNTVRLECEGNFYYYNLSAADKGISAMVTFGDAIGFNGIDMMSNISESIPQNGEVYSPTAADFYFVFGEPEVEKWNAIYYTYDNIRVDFFFCDAYLAATMIQDTSLWDPTDLK